MKEIFSHKWQPLQVNINENHKRFLIMLKQYVISHSLRFTGRAKHLLEIIRLLVIRQMKRENVVKLQKAVAPYVDRSIHDMDRCVKFMTHGDYDHPNPAISAVRMPLVVGFWTIIALTATTLIWGAFAPIESAAVASGTVTLLSNKKIIQHLEGGIIEEALVKDGDKVIAGQPLIRLSNVAALANRDMVQGQLYTALATERRFIAIRDGASEVSFGQDIMDKSIESEEVSKIMESQISLFNSQLETQISKVESLKQRVLQMQEQEKGLIAQKSGTQASLELLKQNLSSIQQLLSQGYATRTQLINVEREARTLEGSLGQYDSDIAKVGQGMTEANMEIVTQESDFKTSISNGLREAQTQVSDLTEKLRAAQDVAKRTLITAPTSGIVNASKYHTIGGVISPGAPIMEIIPQDDQLIIEAHIKPTDIDVVHEGLDARVLFTAYKARNTPKVPGKIIQVSADKIVDMQSNPPASYYVAQVQVDKAYLSKVNGNIDLYPGMPADVLIKTGSRSFLSYLFAPITDSMHRAFREE